MADFVLSDDQKRQLYHDGFLVVKGILPPELTHRAREAILEQEASALGATDTVGRKTLGRPMLNPPPGFKDPLFPKPEALTDLVNRSPVTPMLEDLFGPFQAPDACQLAWKPRAPAADAAGTYGGAYSVSGHKEADMPYFGAWPHLDGQCGLTIAQEPVAGTRDEVYDFLVNSGPKGDAHGRSAMQ